MFMAVDSQLVLCSFGLKLGPLWALLLLSKFLAFSVNLCWSHSWAVFIECLLVLATMLSASNASHLILTFLNLCIESSSLNFIHKEKPRFRETRSFAQRQIANKYMAE